MIFPNELIPNILFFYSTRRVSTSFRFCFLCYCIPTEVGNPKRCVVYTDPYGKSYGKSYEISTFPKDSLSTLIPIIALLSVLQR